MQSEPGPMAATPSGVLGRSSEQSTRTSDGGDWRPPSPQIELVAKLQRQLQSKDAEIAALKVSYAAERVFLKIMLTAVRQLSVMAALEHILQPMAVWSPCCRSKYSSSRRPRSTAPARPILMAMIPYSCPHPLQNVHPQHTTVSLPCEFSQTTRYTIA